MCSPHEMQNPAGGPGFAEKDDLDADDFIMPALRAKDNPELGKVQRESLLKLLRRGSVCTLEATDKLGIMSPPSTICQLRKLGYAISSVRGTEVDKRGRRHHGVARYTLQEAVAE